MEISIEGSLFANITCACIINQLFSVIKVSGGAGFFYLVCAHCDKDEFKIDNKHSILYSIKVWQRNTTATTVTAYKWASKHFSYRRPICNISKMKRLLVANQTDEKGFRLQVLQHHNHSKSWLKLAICARLLLCMPTKKINRSTSIDDRMHFLLQGGTWYI